MTIIQFSEEMLSEALEKVILIAKEAGRITLRGCYSAGTGVYNKNPVDLVTDTDKEVEEYVIAELSRAYPFTSFLAEESAHSEYDLSDKPTWIIDPIDGTTNFVHKLPMFCVSIGLAVNRQVVLGVIYNPTVDELFTAVKNKGAFLNGVPIKVANATRLREAVVSSNIGSDRSPENIAYILEKLHLLMSNETLSFRSGGSAACAMAAVACGRLDAFYEKGIHPWDIAAGTIIVQEAGGAVSDIHGEPFDLVNRRVLCGNPKIIEVISSLFAKGTKGC